MAEVDRARELSSKAESLMAARLESTLGLPITGQPRLKLRRNMSPTQLVGQSPGWSSYVANELDDVLGIQPSDHIPEEIPHWPSGHSAAFRWKEFKRFGKAPIVRAVWNKGARGQLGVPLWNKRTVINDGFEDAHKNHLRYVRDLGKKDPAAKKFVDAYSNSESEEELNTKLRQHYPKTTSESPYDIRVRTLYSTEIDFVVCQESGWDKPMTAANVNRSEEPLYASEFDGMTGACVVNGELRYSPLMVMSNNTWQEEKKKQMIYRYRDGNIDRSAVSKRLVKFRDKLALNEDLRIPMTILPHIGLTVTTDTTSNMSYMAADIAFFHSNAISKYVRSPKYLDDSWTEQQIAHTVATHSVFGNRLPILKSHCVGVRLERSEISLPKESEEEVLFGYKVNENYQKTLLHKEYLIERMEERGYTIDVHLKSLGLDRDHMPALRVIADHQFHGEQIVDRMLIPGLGCGLHPELDHLQMSGLASGMLLQTFTDMDQNDPRS